MLSANLTKAFELIVWTAYVIDTGFQKKLWRLHAVSLNSEIPDQQEIEILSIAVGVYKKRILTWKPKKSIAYRSVLTCSDQVFISMRLMILDSRLLSLSIFILRFIFRFLSILEEIHSR